MAIKAAYQEDGLTVLEVIAVLVILAVITAFIIFRYQDNPTKLFARVEVIKAHIRYAQARSMNTSDSWGFVKSADGKQYWLFNEINQNRVAPGEESLIVNIEQFDMVINSMVINSSPVSFISFDDKGRPCSDNNGRNPITSDLSMVISSGGITQPLLITKNTGFIP